MSDPMTEPETTSDKVCIGFGEREGVCENIAGTPWTPLWCTECDEQRRSHITEQMEGILASFEVNP